MVNLVVVGVEEACVATGAAGASPGPRPYLTRRADAAAAPAAPLALPITMAAITAPPMTITAPKAPTSPAISPLGCCDSCSPVSAVPKDERMRDRKG